ncbi:F0F1 ATP synthase subunit B' [Sphingomonas daechungensis]|uniref:ATP synthase subunit b n=1 Tax=Sphingomonas daechungensis TaxID=1176646 RepID=A0ABX6SZD5_9SPHN|nr:ATPase [Sphingomonas daechungensis]QNP42934.1 ATPase [Sphingomonas daechungensis]
MPQINQLSEVFISQLFWLLLVFGIIYFWIGRGMVPKIQSVVEDRDRKIAEDLAAAQSAREQAEAAEEAYRERIDASRSEALKVAQDAKQQAGLDTEKRLKAVDDKVAKKIADAEAKIREAADAARHDLETVAADAASELVAKLTGQKIAPKDAQPAVKAVLNG